MAMNADHRSKIRSPSPAIVMSLFGRKILEWDKITPKTKKKPKQTMIISFEKIWEKGMVISKRAGRGVVKIRDTIDDLYQHITN